LARFRINIFYVISSICSLLLVGYVWFIFLPTYENTLHYEVIRSITIMIVMLLLISAGIQIFLSIIKEKSQKPT